MIGHWSGIFGIILKSMAQEKSNKSIAIGALQTSSEIKAFGIRSRYKNHAPKLRWSDGWVSA